MRDLASSLLDSKGCVTLQWQRTNKNAQGQKGWEVAYKVIFVLIPDWFWHHQ